MAQTFRIGDSTPVTTTVPTVDVPPLPAGTYEFELVVEDDQGKKSPPVTARVVVQKTLPDAVLKAPERVEPESSIRLDGTASTAVSPARPAKFHWRLKPAVQPNES